MYLVGAKGHGKVILDILEDLEIKVDGFLDVDESINSVYQYKVLHSFPNERNMFISIGNNATRKMIVNNHPQFNYLTLIHPKTAISKRAKIGEGSVIMSGVSVNTEVQIGKHCIINTNASIDHECVIEDYVHISPNVALAGNVEVGEGTHIGIGTAVIQGIKIGKWCTIGAGAVIIKDIPDGATVVGNPGRIIKIKDS
ncbi:acetyltransferase [Empedobacter sp. 225-1]|uniref:acetyltransferase n=1 Tax=Empedobacter TaxID=59734 RepID=UPI001CE1C1DE|nr:MULTISPECIES: acetyltransferase [Empedobacter]MCA4782194.1 acetyltransferase [Empedobacter stercoris]MDM1522300.1 acetyltransferase [Empedobacter sp. 225-1]